MELVQFGAKPSIYAYIHAHKYINTHFRPAQYTHLYTGTCPPCLILCYIIYIYDKVNDALIKYESTDAWKIMNKAPTKLNNIAIITACSLFM